jgi:flagellar P-ring protein FlgI
MKLRTRTFNSESSEGIRWLLLSLLLVSMAGSILSGQTRIRDICRPLGERTNLLIGHGVVVGLKGTGDSGDNIIAMGPFRELLENNQNHVDVKDLSKTKNIAYVFLTAEIPRNGIREGGIIDVKVHSVGDAKSLAGGTLYIGELQSSSVKDTRILGQASGALTIPDTKVPTNGIVKNGGKLEGDVNYDFVDYDSFPGKAIFTLVLDHEQANWQAAKAIADIINEEAAPINNQAESRQGADLLNEPTAVILNAKNIRVFIPSKQARYPQPFISRIMRLPVDLPEPEAMIAINEKTGVIAITGNVEISPVFVTVKDLSVRIVTPPPSQPVISDTDWAKIDTTNTSTVKLQQLIDALDQLNVPVQDKINVIYEMKSLGAIQANIRTEN